MASMQYSTNHSVVTKLYNCISFEFCMPALPPTLLSAGDDRCCRIPLAKSIIQSKAKDTTASKAIQEL